MRTLGLALTILAAASAAGAAPRAEPLPVETALGEKSMGLYSQIRLSPDQRRVAYAICDSRRVPPEPDIRYQAHSRSGVWRFGVGCDVWITEVATGESKNLTEGTASNWAPQWSPDGRTLAYYSDRSGAAALWAWSIASGKSRRVSEVVVRPWGSSNIVWTPDSRSVVIPVLPEGVTIQQAAEGRTPAKSAEPARADGVTVTVFENRPSAKGKGATAETGAWSTELLRSDLARIEIETGNLHRLVTRDKPTWTDISPDGSLLAVTLDRGFAAAQSQQQLFDIQVVPTAGGAARRIAQSVPLSGLGISAGWSPDGKSVAYTTGDGDLFVAPLAGGSPRKVNETPVPGLSLDFTAVPFFDPRGEWICFESEKKIFRISTKGRSTAKEITPEGREATGLVPGGPGQLLVLTRREDTKDEGLYELDLGSGATRKIWEGPKGLGRDKEFRVAAGSDVVVFTPQDAGHPEDLWALRRSGGKTEEEPRRLTHINPAFDEYVMGESRLIEWRNDDGKPLRGALLLPAGYREGQRYPLVVFIYGGAHLSDALRSFGMRDAWGVDDNFQMLATRGYAVLLPDAPSDRKDQMRDLPKNVLPGVNRVIELGIADPERLGVMGHSNGGYSTLALITRTPRFKAAVMRAGLGNFVSFYGELSHDGTHYGLSVAESAFGMGTPWNSLPRYLENSPVLYLDRVETPLLIVHGSRDEAVAPHLAEEVFVDLQRLGKEVVLARYEGEGHSIEGFANQVDYVNRMIAWFDEHLKGK